MKIYKDFAQVLIKRASDLYKDDYFRIGLKEKVYAFDSSTMKLCLNLYPWAKFHHNKGTFKMHTLIIFVVLFLLSYGLQKEKSMT